MGRAQRACSSGKATITRARGVLLMDRYGLWPRESGSQSSLGPVQHDFLEGQGDLSRKRLDKCPGGCPEEEEGITTHSEEWRCKSKAKEV